MVIPDFDITKSPHTLEQRTALAAVVLRLFKNEGGPFTPGDAGRVIETIEQLYAEHGWPRDAQFTMGDHVQKKGRASWRGKVVGWYRTDLTSLGYAVESAFEPGSVQIYPATALIPWELEI